MADPDPLDNAVWYALATRQRDLRAPAPRSGTGAAQRFVPDVSIFAALPDEPSADDWQALAELTGPDAPAVLFRAPTPVPEGWSVQMDIVGVQMVGSAVVGARCDEAVVLGVGDVADMLDLVGRTRPGPFGPRTVELGRYLGIRRAGALVAMAGQRLRPEGCTEISAVCTDEDHRGEGLATALVRHLVADITEAGEVPFLHASETNDTAISLYETMGFTVRRRVQAVALSPPSSSPPST